MEVKGEREEIESLLERWRVEMEGMMRGIQSWKEDLRERKDERRGEGGD